MEVLDLLESIKPCTCGTIVETAMVGYPSGEAYHLTLQEIDVADLKDVTVLYSSELPKDADLDERRLFCPACGKSWIEWNYITNCGLQEKISALPRGL